MEAFGKVCFTFFAIVLSAVLGGYVFMKLWNWFVATAFDLRHLTLVQSMGLSLMVSWLRPAKKDEEEDEPFAVKLGKLMLRLVILALVTLFFGWLIFQLV